MEHLSSASSGWLTEEKRIQQLHGYQYVDPHKKHMAIPIGAGVGTNVELLSACNCKIPLYPSVKIP